jgi:hypothetical protein
VIIHDGTVVLFPLGLQDPEGTIATQHTLSTPMTDCRAVETPPDGRIAVIVGQTQTCVVSINAPSLMAM